MGAYNNLSLRWKDKLSNREFDIVLQFRYGEVWQHEYKIGDVLKWGEINEGDKTDGEVHIEAIVENDDLAIFVPEYFEIVVKDNVIEQVRPLTDKNKYFDAGINYILLK